MIKVLVSDIFTQTHLAVLNIKNCISKWPIKIFIKRRTNASKAYAYGMLLSFNLPMTYNFFLTLQTAANISEFLIKWGS